MELQKPARLSLQILKETFAVCRMDPSEGIPSWFRPAPLSSVTYTDDELSLIVPHGDVPEDVQAEKGWRAIKVMGPLDFSLTGILSSVASPLAERSISIFATSTFDTDYILVKDENLDRARGILEKDFDFID